MHHTTRVFKRIAAGILFLIFCFQAAPAYSYDGDSIVVVASHKYKRNGLGRLIFGTNYREDWETPVKMPVLDIHKERGGLTLVSLKGGFESISMNMVTIDSVQLVLRTIDKDLKKLIPKMLKHTFIQSITQDIISSSEPYAPLTVTIMANALGLVTTNPKLFYVDDTAFGKYHEFFDGKVCLLEDRIPVRPGTKHEEMESPFTKVRADNHNVVLQKDLLRARLFDMIIGDWDRHPGQWNWGSYDSAGNKYFYPVAVDRDMVYFNCNGAFLGYIRIYAVHYMRGFKSRICKLYWFNKKARDFDRLLLNELSADDWAATIKEVQGKLNDSIVNLAVNQMPAEILALRGNEIKQKLKSRRDGLYPAAMKYYGRLAKHVYIATSDKPDYVKATRNNQQTDLAIYNSADETEQGRIYHRVFDRKQTKRIYLVGIADNDKTELPSKSSTKIKIIRAGQKNFHKYDIRQWNMKLLGKSVNHLGQPGFKG